MSGVSNLGRITQSPFNNCTVCVDRVAEGHQKLNVNWEGDLKKSSSQVNVMSGFSSIIISLLQNVCHFDFKKQYACFT